MEIVKVYKENMPHVKLIGKRYTNKDRDETGTFSIYWQQWFREGWFDVFKQCRNIPKVSDDYLGVMRMSDGGNDFEYWIGAFFAPNSNVPDEFEAVEIPAGDLGVCWLYGNEADLYGMEAYNQSMAALTEKGWSISENSWFFERYNCPRFTAPDEKGNVILDFCTYLG